MSDKLRETLDQLAQIAADRVVTRMCPDINSQVKADLLRQFEAALAGAASVGEGEALYDERWQIEAAASILCGAAQILDVVKQEWGESWSEWDQSIREGLSGLQQRLLSQAGALGATSVGAGEAHLKGRLAARIDEYVFVRQMISGIEKEGWYQRRLAHLQEMYDQAGPSGALAGAASVGPSTSELIIRFAEIAADRVVTPMCVSTNHAVRDAFIKRFEAEARALGATSKPAGETQP